MVKNILVISYGIREFDGRLKEIIKSCEQVTKTKILCLTEQNHWKNDNFQYIDIKNRNYLSFTLYWDFFKTAFKLFRKSRKKNKNLVVFIDNFYAAPVGFLIKIFYPKTVVIQDCRELYFAKDMPKFGKLFCILEEKLMKKAKLVFCANKYRSKIMKERFRLKSYPVVFDNIRLLDSSQRSENISEKYVNDFKYQWNVVSSGGYSLGRKTEELIRDFDKLDHDKYGLYIVGNGSESDRLKLDTIIREKNIKNIHFIDRVSMNELKYIVDKCQIGVVSYHQRDLNNEYCSSGKIYEYMGEGLPVITTENIPLVEFCEKNKVGASNNEFDKSLIDVSTNYNYYKQNVDNFMNNLSISDNNNSMANEIEEAINIIER